jgi:hypothetical protein
MSQVNRENGFVAIEEDEERLINILISNLGLELLYQDGPSNFFKVDEFSIYGGMKIELFCTRYLPAKVIDLTYYDGRKSSSMPLIFFPGCYKKDITLSIDMPEGEYLLPEYVYKIGGIPSDQINSISADGSEISYLVLDKIINREGFSYLDIQSKNHQGAELIVATSEGSYLKDNFSYTINKARSNRGVDLVPIITYMTKSGIIEKEESVYLDSLHDRSYIKFIDGID